MVIIVVEGNDDKKFLITLLNDIKNDNSTLFKKEVDFNDCIEIMGGKKSLLDSNNSKYQKINKKIELGIIKKALFIFDCDFIEDDNECNGVVKSKKCYDKLIKKLNLNIPTQCHIFDKNLDYFLVETIKDKECYEYFDNLTKCLKIEKLKPNKKPIANLYRDLYPYPKFDFKDEKFEILKQKLQNLFT